MPILVASALVAFVAVSSVAAFGPYEMGYNGESIVEMVS